ncbi:MAG: hypothetical protein Q4C81_01140 [Kocuria sp.]|nr:hypothetical protein [Kocuria sp.]
MKLTRSSLLILTALLRNRRHWGGIVALVLLVAILTVLFLVTSATRLTPTQQTEANLGDAMYMVSAPGDQCAPSECDIAADMTHSLESLGATKIRTTSSASKISLEGTDDHAPTVHLSEADWTHDFHPEAYRLVEGRWPSSPEEVAVTDDSTLGLGLGSKTSFYGHTPVTVVGVVDVIYIPSQTSMLIAPGGIDRIYSDLKSQGNRYATPDVQTEIRWDGPGLADAVPELATVVAQTQNLDQDAARSSLQQSATERDESSRPPWDWFFNTPALWGILPVCVVTFIMGVIAVLPNRDVARRITHQLSLVGISDTTTTFMVTCYRLLLLGLAVLSGTVIGYGLSLAARPPLEKIVGHALSPAFFPVFFALVTFFLSSAVPCLITLWQLMLPYLKRVLTWLDTPLGRKTLGVLIVVGSTAGTFWALRGITTVGDSYDHMTRSIVVLAVVAAFLLSMVVTWALGWEPRHLTLILPWRRMRSQRLLSGAVALLSALAVIIPLSLGIALTTTSFYGSLKEIGTVPQGSVALGENNVNFGGTPPDVLNEFSEYTGLTDPVGAHVSSVSTESGNGVALAVESPEDVERLIGRPLTAPESQVWANNGLLSGDDLYKDQEKVTLEIETNDGSTKSVEEPVAYIASMPREYGESRLGFISLDAVENLGAMSLPPYHIYTGASQDQNDAASRAPDALGFDAQWIDTYKTPEFSGPSQEVTFLAGALGTTLLVAVVAVARVLSSRLQPYGASLTALGLGPGILGKTLGITLGYVVVVPLIIGTATAIGANAWGWSMLGHGYTIAVPWRWVAVYSSAIFLVIIFTIAVFTLRISRTRHRHLM